jgi:hypothetical protein
MDSITLTPLELALLGGFLTLIVTTVVRTKYISRSDCKARRQEIDSRIQARLDKIDHSLSIIFQQQRAMITLSNLPDDKKVELLNVKGD